MVRTKQETDMKIPLHMVDCSDLNTYTTDNSRNLGWGTIPSICEAFPELDGVVILNNYFLEEMRNLLTKEIV